MFAKQALLLLLAAGNLIPDTDGASISPPLKRSKRQEIKFLPEAPSCGQRQFKDSWVANIEGSSSSSSGGKKQSCLAILIDEGEGSLLLLASSAACNNLNQEGNQNLVAKFAIQGSKEEIRLPVQKKRPTVAQNELIVLFQLKEPLDEQKSAIIQPVCLASEKQTADRLAGLQCKVVEEKQNLFKCPTEALKEEAAGCGQPLVTSIESRSFLLGFGKCDSSKDEEEEESLFINISSSFSVRTLLEPGQNGQLSSSSENEEEEEEEEEEEKGNEAGDENQSSGEKKENGNKSVTFPAEKEQDTTTPTAKKKKKENCPLIGLCNELLYSCYCPLSSSESCTLETLLSEDSLCPVYSFCPPDEEVTAPPTKQQQDRQERRLPSFPGPANDLVDSMKRVKPSDVCGAKSLISSRIVSAGKVPVAVEAVEKRKENDFQFPGGDDGGVTSSEMVGTSSSSATIIPPVAFRTKEGGDDDEDVALEEEKASSISTASPTTEPQILTTEETGEDLQACNGQNSFPCKIPHGVCEGKKEEEEENDDDDVGDDREKRCRCQAGFRWEEGEKQCNAEEKEKQKEQERLSDADDGNASNNKAVDLQQQPAPLPRSAVVKRAARRRKISVAARFCDSTEDLACIFPFRFEGRLNYECVKFTSSKNKYEITQKSFCPRSVDETTREPNGIKPWMECSSKCRLMKYHTTHKDLLNDLRSMTRVYPNNAELFSGLGGNPGEQTSGMRLEFRPRVKLIGNMHGNEPVGRELLINMARFLLESAAGEREGDPEAERARNIVETTDLYILPTMNPDGFSRGDEGECSGGSYSAGRLNEGHKDLNRDFPTWWDWKQQQKNSSYDIFADRQKETQLMMKWILEGNFLLSANFHDGAVLVNYPYDNYHDNEQTFGVFKTPDHDEFYTMSTAYSLNHRTMNDTLKACQHWGTFENGVTNGADWYPVRGGMQDFNYLFATTMEVTVEVSCCKFAPRWRLLWEWANNRKSLISYVEQAQTGIKGKVVNAKGEPVQGALVQVRKRGSVEWRKTVVTTNENGVYWRILVPGEYEVQATMGVAEEGGERVVRARSEVARFEVRDVLRPTVIRLQLRAVRKMVKRPALAGGQDAKEEELSFEG